MSDGGEIFGTLCGGLCAVCAASALWECGVMRACGLGDTSRPCCGGQRGCCPGLADCCKPNRQRRDGAEVKQACSSANGTGANVKESAPPQTATQDDSTLNIGDPVSNQPKAQIQMSVPPSSQQTAQ